jgi:8-oxo-dGTP pyrophosphatase MutT (NUDIX family)
MTKEAVSVVISNDKKEILLLQRGPASRNEIGKWENLGGELLAGEDSIRGLRREAREELGINLVIKCKIFTINDYAHGWSVGLYSGTAVGIPKIQEESKCTALQWILLADIFRQDLASFTVADFNRINEEHLLDLL